MRRNGFERWRRFGAGAVLLLLLHGLSTARTARAGCDHPATAISQAGTIHHDLERLLAVAPSLGDRADDGLDSPSGEPAAPPARCTGPGCSSRDSAPTSTTASGVDHPDRWGDLNSAPIFPVLSPWFAMSEETVERAAGARPSIFHPPPRRPSAFSCGR